MSSHSQRAIPKLEGLEDRTVLSSFGFLHLGHVVVPNSMSGITSSLKEQLAFLGSSSAATVHAVVQRVESFVDHAEHNGLGQENVLNISMQTVSKLANEVVRVDDGVAKVIQQATNPNAAVAGTSGNPVWSHGRFSPANLASAQLSLGLPIAHANPNQVAAPVETQKVAALGNFSDATSLEQETELIDVGRFVDHSENPQDLSLLETEVSASARNVHGAIGENFDDEQSLSPQEAGLLAPGLNPAGDTLGLAIQQFLNQLDDLGRELSRALAPHGLLLWLGTGLAGAAALEVARRTRVQRERRPFALAGDRWNWVPGLPNSTPSAEA